jgi:hypothetical protein
MSQDNPNEPTITEESLPSAQSHAKQVDPGSEQATTETQVAEPAMDETAEDVAEEDADAEDDSRDEATETETSSPSDSSNSATPPTPSDPETDVDERSDIEKQPYDFDQCTVQIAIQLLPSDGDANGRMVVVGVRSHLDAPILRVTRLNELGTLPPLVTALLDELKAELPKREQAAREAFEKKKAERAERRAAVTASRIPRGKKSRATAMATAPASSNPSATDNRPRPEVQATTSPQAQMGLF